MKLKILNKIPEPLYHCKVEQLHSILGGPTLIHIKKTDSTIFLSTLLHGNEHSGFYSIQKFLQQSQLGRKASNHSLLLFIGNTKAADDLINSYEL